MDGVDYQREASRRGTGTGQRRGGLARTSIRLRGQQRRLTGGKSSVVKAGRGWSRLAAPLRPCERWITLGSRDQEARRESRTPAPGPGSGRPRFDGVAGPLEFPGEVTASVRYWDGWPVAQGNIAR